jgi:hypothetical protein
MAGNCHNIEAEWRTLLSETFCCWLRVRVKTSFARTRLKLGLKAVLRNRSRNRNRNRRNPWPKKNRNRNRILALGSGSGSGSCCKKNIKLNLLWRDTGRHMHEAGKRRNQIKVTGRSFYRKNNLNFEGRNRNRSRNRNRNRNGGQKIWDPEPEPRQNGTVPQHWLKGLSYEPNSSW